MPFFNVLASYQIKKTFQIYGRVDKCLHNRYATVTARLSIPARCPNFANGGAPIYGRAFCQSGAGRGPSMPG